MTKDIWQSAVFYLVFILIIAIGMYVDCHNQQVAEANTQHSDAVPSKVHSQPQEVAVVPEKVDVSRGVATERVRGYDKKLVSLVFSEARGESYRGKVMVAEVVRNREREWQMTTTEVVTQDGQFDGSLDIDVTDPAVYAEICDAIDDAYLMDSNYARGALYYLNPDCVSEYTLTWFRSLKFCIKEGRHEFRK